MRHFRIAWPTVLAAVGCTTFLFTYIATPSMTFGYHQNISPTNACSSEISANDFADKGIADTDIYREDGEQDSSIGDYYYQQKYGYIYAQPQQQLGNEIDVDEEDSPIDGTISAEHGEETDSYIYQFEEVADAETADTEENGAETSDTETPDTMSQDKKSEYMKYDGSDYEFRYSEAMDYGDQSYGSEYSEDRDAGTSDSESADTQPLSQEAEAKDTEAKDAEAKDAEAKDTDSTDYESMDFYESQDEDSQNTTQSTEADRHGYTYALPEDLYGSSTEQSTEIVAVEELMKQPQIDDSHHSDDRYTGSPYTREYPGEFENNEHLALFTWDPAKLLTWSDRETLRLLAIVPDRASGVRRAVLSDYVESLGLEAVELSNRLAEESGLDVMTLADDLAQTAAFLACFRLAERGELDSDEALSLLHKSLLQRSNRWNCWIDEVTGNESSISTSDDAKEANTAQAKTAQANTSPANPVLRAVVRTAAGSLESIGGTISGISRQMQNIY